MEASTRPNILGTLPSVCSLFFLLCVVECLAVCNAKLTFFVSSIVWHLSHLQAQSSLRAHSVATLSQTHPRLCQPHMCFHLVWFVFHFNRFCGLPPFRASPLEHMLLDVKSPHLAFGHRPSGSPQAVSNHFRQKWQFHLCPDLPCNPCCSCTVLCPHVIFFFFEPHQMSHRLRFPSFNSVQRGLTQGPIFASEERRKRHVPPSCCTSLSTARLCFCKSAHLSTMPCLHFASFLQCPRASSLDGSKRSLESQRILRNLFCDVPFWCQS